MRTLTSEKKIIIELFPVSYNVLYIHYRKLLSSAISAFTGLITLWMTYDKVVEKRICCQRIRSDPKEYNKGMLLLLIFLVMKKCCLREPRDDLQKFKNWSFPLLLVCPFFIILGDISLLILAARCRPLLLQYSTFAVIHLFCSLSYDRSLGSSKASSQQGAI
jgi:hypothetical protein